MTSSVSGLLGAPAHVRQAWSPDDSRLQRAAQETQARVKGLQVRLRLSQNRYRHKKPLGGLDIMVTGNGGPTPFGPSAWAGPSRSPRCTGIQRCPMALLLALLLGSLGIAPAWKVDRSSWSCGLTCAFEYPWVPVVDRRALWLMAHQWHGAAGHLESSTS
jgi:hypothetical protein